MPFNTLRTLRLPKSWQRAIPLAGALTLLMSCGGGDSGAEPSAAITVNLVNGGTLLTCQSVRPMAVDLVKMLPSPATTLRIECPSTHLVANEYALTTWRLLQYVLPLETEPFLVRTLLEVRTRLAAPVVIRNGVDWFVQPLNALQGAAASRLRLELVSELGVIIAAIEQPAGAISPGMDVPETARWRWAATTDSGSYRSSEASRLQFNPLDTGFWGPLAVGNFEDPAQAQLLGSEKHPLSATAQFQSPPLALIGSSALYADRDSRDLRVVDLNNDGLPDIVSNVYGQGCALIGIQGPAGSYTFSEPKRKDGSCIGGNGETILVADFDGDGLVDILLPSYQRFDFLKNLGNGNFVEIADELGISYPNYLPQVEGAAAVDIDLDGDIDIVIASEVLLNDGTGHFAPMPSPFGNGGRFDEGMSVVDLDNDGVFDIVKNDPTFGPRIFWGRPGALSFDDAGWLLGGTVVADSSYGFATGDLTGDGLADIAFAGGFPVGSPPRLCTQQRQREFACPIDVIAARPDMWQDLLLITDLDGDGMSALVSRFGTIHLFSANISKPEYVFRIDLRDNQGLRNQYGRVVKATCAIDGSLIGMNFVDGGNGYMAQGDYVITFASNWCHAITVTIPAKGGAFIASPLQPGTHVIRERVAG